MDDTSVTSTTPNATVPPADSQPQSQAQAPLPDQTVNAPVETQASSDQSAPAAQQPADKQTSSVMDDLYKPDPEPTENNAPVVPETYDFEGVELPDDVSVVEDGKSLVSAIGKELSLTNDQARALLQKGMPLLTASVAARRDQLTRGWLAEIKADPELGGNNFSQTRANLNRAIKRYGGAGAFEVLNQSGLGSNPAIVRMLNAIGRDLGEDNSFISAPGGNMPSKADRLRALYNNSKELNYGE